MTDGASGGYRVGGVEINGRAALAGRAGAGFEWWLKT